MNEHGKTAWDDLLRRIARCRACRLHKIRRRPVMPRGVPNATFLFICECPGKDEWVRGQVLVGKSGRLFNRLLSDASIDKYGWLATNAMQCYHGERKFPKELGKVCADLYLLDILKVVNPTVLVLMGQEALTHTLPESGLVRIGATEGKAYEPYPEWRAANMKMFIPTFHPAYTFRSPAAVGDIRAALRYAVALSVRKGWIEDKRGTK